MSETRTHREQAILVDGALRGATLTLIIGSVVSGVPGLLMFALITILLSFLIGLVFGV